MKRPSYVLVTCCVLVLAFFVSVQAGIIQAIIPQAVPTANKRGNATVFQLATSTATATAGTPFCDDGSGNTTTSGCAPLSSGIVNTTPVTVSTNTTNDQTMMELALTAGQLNSLAPYDFFGAGVYTLPVAQTPTLTFKLKLCTVSGCGSGTVVTLASITTTAATASVTNLNWNLRFVGITHTTGATGNIEFHGRAVADLGAVTTAADSVFGDTNTAASGTIDLTATLFVDYTIAFSTGSASNSMTQRSASMSPLGGGSPGASDVVAPPYLQVGSKNFGPGFQLTAPPAIGTLTFVNQGGATATNENGAILLAAPTSAGNNIRFLRRASYPSTPFTFTVGVLPNGVVQDFMLFGIAVSDGTGFVTFDLELSPTAGGIVCSSVAFTNASTAAFNYFATPCGAMSPNAYITLSDDGTNFTMWASNNPLDLQRVQVFQVSRTDFLTPSQIGIFVNCNNATFAASGLFFHWVGI